MCASSFELLAVTRCLLELRLVHVLNRYLCGWLETVHHPFILFTWRPCDTQGPSQGFTEQNEIAVHSTP